MDLSSLKTLFNIDFSPNIDITLINKQDDNKVTKEGDKVMIHIPELDPDEREEIVDLTRDHFEVEDKVLRDSEEEETTDIKNSYESEYDEIINFFDGIIFERHVSILEKSLYLRGLIEKRDLTKQQIDKRKLDLSRRMGHEASYICNLSTSGYFDKNRTIREIYQQLYLDDSYKNFKFKDEFEKIIDHKLLCVFVERDQTVYEVTQEVKGRLAKYQREDPLNNYVDIRGTGGNCEEIITSVVDNLEEEFVALDCSQWTEGDQMVVRIHTASLPNLGSSYQ